MTSRVFTVGKGHGLEKIVRTIMDVHELDRESEALRRALLDWKWSHDQGGKSKKLNQILNNQMFILGIIADGSGIDVEKNRELKRIIDETYTLLDPVKDGVSKP